MRSYVINETSDQVELRAQIAERNSRKADEDRKRKEQEEREERKIMLQRE